MGHSVLARHAIFEMAFPARPKSFRDFSEAVADGYLADTLIGNELGLGDNATPLILGRGGTDEAGE